METKIIETFEIPLVIKCAECKEDINKLNTIYRNIQYVNSQYPYLSQRVLKFSGNILLLEGFKGISFDSRSACDVFRDDRILEQIIMILRNFRKNKHSNISPYKKLSFFFKPVIQSLSWGKKLPPYRVLKSILTLLLSEVKWCDSHGDFTTYNMIIDQHKVLHLIDWEEFNVRPKYYDLFTLVFNQCIPIERLSWQKKLLFKYFIEENISEVDLHYIQNITIFVLLKYYLLEIYRKKNWRKRSVQLKYPGCDLFYFEQRAKVRYENLLLSTTKDFESLLCTTLRYS